MVRNDFIVGALLVTCACSRATSPETQPRVTPEADARAEVRPDVAKIGDAAAWRTMNAEARVAVEGGKQVLRLAPIGGNRKGSNIGMALAAGVACAEGTIDVDLRGQGEGGASFVGVAFGVEDAGRYEAVYFRPFRFRSTDAVQRSHAVQYVAWPEHTWEALRAQSPGVYESAIAPAPDPAGWFHAHIEIGHAQVKVFIDGAAQPTLVVSRLRNARGGVALWVDSQEGSFANLQIRPAA
ncbi:MAG TPA: hypothetical protein VLM79_21815 [Kofleriaceae bacterium]|nr:hypothetical protein [Kofleriaceae bacterium]